MGILAVLFITVPVSIGWCQILGRQIEEPEWTEHRDDPNYWGWLD